jgi:hypothetical protein
MTSEHVIDREAARRAEEDAVLVRHIADLSSGSAEASTLTGDLVLIRFFAAYEPLLCVRSRSGLPSQFRHAIA